MAGKNDVFIIGAGFSRAVSAEMPLLHDLGSAIRHRLGLAAPSGVLADDVELWLTYLAHEHPWLTPASNLRNHAVLLDASRVIANAVNDGVAKTITNPIPSWLSKLVEWWHLNHSTVVTLNYDTLIERAASGINTANGRLWCGDLYPVPLTAAGQRLSGMLADDPRPTFSLFKLHGSTNWAYSGASTFLGETIYYVPVVGGWNPDDDALRTEYRHRQAIMDKVPFIVPPLSEKIPFFQHETVRQQWKQSARALQFADRVFAIGYSLPKTDLTMRFLINDNAPRDRTKFYPVDIRPEVSDHYRSLLPRAYEVDDSFVGADAVARLTGFLDTA